MIQLGIEQRRRALSFVGLAERTAPPRLDEPDGPALLSRLDREYDNVRAAMGRLLDSGDSQHSVQLAGALWSFWEVRFRLSEGLTWLDAVLARDKEASTSARAGAHRCGGAAP
jgi:predicted ATPase